MDLRPSEPFTPYHHGDPALSHARASKTHQRATQAHRRRTFLTRQVIAWDGEGVTDKHGNHHYTLLANSVGGVWTGTPQAPIPTEVCLTALLDCAQAHPQAVHVIYGGSYDSNMMLADLTRDEVWRVYNSFRCGIRSWRLSYKQGKSLWVSDGKRTMTLWDVVSFFQCRFTAACDSYLSDCTCDNGHDLDEPCKTWTGAWPDRDQIIREKANRGSFRQEDAGTVLDYCRAELRVLCLLVHELRQRLARVDLYLSRWDGPGACATTLMQREGVKQHLSLAPKRASNDPAPRRNTVPVEVAEAARYAYAGGRFELVQFGHTEEPTYEYDIGSAYPAALQHVPSLQGGRWRHHGRRLADLSGMREFTLCRVKFQSADHTVPQPFYRRDPSGAVCYPYCTMGWYWLHEVRAAQSFLARYGGMMIVEEAWEYEDNDVRPFAFIPDLYAERQVMKRANDGGHVGIKLSLNSLYLWEARTASGVDASSPRT